MRESYVSFIIVTSLLVLLVYPINPHIYHCETVCHLCLLNFFLFLTNLDILLLFLIHSPIQCPFYEIFNIPHIYLNIFTIPCTLTLVISQSDYFLLYLIDSYLNFNILFLTQPVTWRTRKLYFNHILTLDRQSSLWRNDPQWDPPKGSPMGFWIPKRILLYTFSLSLQHYLK